MRSDRLRLRDIGRTSAFRLTVLLGLTFSIGLLGLLGLVYLMTAHELIARTDHILHVQADRLAATAPEALPARISAEIARDNGFSYVALVSESGEPVLGNIRVGPLSKTGRVVELDGPRAPVRMLATRTLAGETIIVARDVSQIRYLRRRIVLILAWSGMLTLLGVAATATLVAIHPLRRVRDLERAARAIAAGGLETRMPIAGRHDELDQFAATVNVMVEEMGRVIAQVKDVTDAVAHDLRTPLTRVRMTLHQATALPDMDPAHVTLAYAAIADLDTVLARFTALLRIAELEAGARRSGFEAVDVGALLAEVHALYEPLAEEQDIAFMLTADSDVSIEGDAKLLFEAVSNLVDNAIKFARSAVLLALEPGADAVTILVRDDGPGIPAEEREAVLRRFHRGENAKALPGSGLGLSVVAAIVHLHGHRLVLGEGGPGLVARLKCPIRPR